MITQVTLQNGKQISIALKQVEGGDAQTYLEALKDNLDELALCSSNSPEEQKQVRAKLMVSLKNMMSDQCASNGVFNRLLQDIRSSLLPGFIDDFER